MPFIYGCMVLTFFSYLYGSYVKRGTVRVVDLFYGFLCMFIFPLFLFYFLRSVANRMGSESDD